MEVLTKFSVIIAMLISVTFMVKLSFLHNSDFLSVHIELCYCSVIIRYSYQYVSVGCELSYQVLFS